MVEALDDFLLFRLEGDMVLEFLLFPLRLTSFAQGGPFSFECWTEIAQPVFRLVHHSHASGVTKVEVLTKEDHSLISNRQDSILHSPVF